MNDFITVGADELGDDLTEEVTCPYCKKKHVVRYGEQIIRNADGTERRVPSRMLAFVKCLVSGHSYLVGIGGKELNNESVPR